MERFVTVLAKRYTVLGIISVINIPVVSIKVMNRQISTTMSANTASVVVTLHNALYKLSVFGKIISVCISNFLRNGFVIAQSVL